MERFNLSEEDVEETKEEDLKESDEEEFSEEIEEESDELEDVDVAIGRKLTVVCTDDLELMDITGAEIRETEERGGFLGFGSSTESHVHLKYDCPSCERSYYHDIQAKRQGCFIATAAYGTPLAGEINVLRNFRDSYLLRRKWGEKFVDIYYTVSPPIADVIGRSESFRKAVRTLLKPIVKAFKRQKED